MKHFFYVAALFCCLCLVPTIGVAQDGKISIELNRDEEVGEGLFVKNNGFWLMTNTNTAAKGITTNRLIKFNTDLSKQEYVVDDLSNLDLSPMYDPLFPNYIYFHRNPLSLNPFKMKVQYYQINKTGKVRLYEEEKEREKDVDMCAGVFNSMGHFGEIWTKKKSKSELILILHDHENFKLTKKNISFSERKDKKKFNTWLYASSYDNILLVTRYEKDVKNCFMQVLVIDMKAGRVLQDFDFQPNLKSKNYVIPATIANVAAKGIFYYDNFGVIDSRNGYQENRYGAMTLSKDGKNLYYYSLNSDEEVPKSELAAVMSFNGTARGFNFIKLGLDGKVIYQQETLFKYKELGADLKNGLKGLTFYEQSNGRVRLQLSMYSGNGLAKKIEKYAMDFETATGKQVNHCLKGVKIKLRVAQKAKNSVESVDDLLPCFIKNEEKITKYITTKQIDGTYNVYDDGESQVLGIFVKKEQTLGLMYFKE